MTIERASEIIRHMDCSTEESFMAKCDLYKFFVDYFNIQNDVRFAELCGYEVFPDVSSERYEKG
jgi:hypothetical protein